MSLIRVVASVVTQNDQYLICQRPVHKRHGGLWEFPGGKVEAGETILDAARRELSEELGVHVRSVGELLLAIHDIGSDFVIEFYPVEITGTPASIEHEAIAWVTANAMLEYLMAPSDRKFAVQFLAPSTQPEHD